MRQKDDLIFQERIEFVNYVLVMKLKMNSTICLTILIFVQQMLEPCIYQNIIYETQMS